VSRHPDPDAPPHADRAEDDGFLGRWSRLKRQAPAASPPAAGPVPAAPGPEPDDRPRDPETGALLDPDWIASLPDIAELTAESDLSAFMRPGVPESLRREAMRAMWTLDPAIRDFVSPALDYALDYNTPGAAPGYGPLSAADVEQALAFARSVFSTPDSAPDADASRRAAAPDGTASHERTPDSCDMESQEPAAPDGSGPPGPSPSEDRHADAAARKPAPAVAPPDASAPPVPAIAAARLALDPSREPVSVAGLEGHGAGPDGAPVALPPATLRQGGPAAVSNRPARRRGGGATPL
jgi:hypothetical protein